MRNGEREGGREGGWKRGEGGREGRRKVGRGAFRSMMSEKVAFRLSGTQQDTKRCWVCCHHVLYAITETT